MTNTASENDLRLLLESASINEVDLRRAEITLATLPQLAGITYADAIKLFEENEKILEVTPVHDPAWQQLSEWRSQYLRYATALNIHQKLGRHDHEIPIHALVSVNGLTTEVNIHIPKYGYFPHRRKDCIESLIRDRLRRASRYAGSLRTRPVVEFIEL